MQFTKFTGLARKLPAPIYKLASQAYIDHDFPRHIFIETTAACQLSCSFCPREKNNAHMDFALFKEIVDEAAQYGPRSFSLHLFGEPLLYPRIIEAIEYIKKKNRRNTVLLTTNGVLLNTYAKELDRVKVDRIIWTVRKNNFNDQSLRLLRRKGLIRILLEEKMDDSQKSFASFPRVEIKHLHNYGGNIDVSKWKVNEPTSRYPCYHLWLAPAVRWNGEIVECCNIPQTGAHVLGKYGETNLRDVWRGRDLGGLRRDHMNGVYPGPCKNCTSWQAYPNMFFGHQCQPATTAACS